MTKREALVQFASGPWAMLPPTWWPTVLEPDAPLDFTITPGAIQILRGEIVRTNRRFSPGWTA